MNNIISLLNFITSHPQNIYCIKHTILVFFIYKN
jgi:hypothetical protein